MRSHSNGVTILGMERLLAILVAFVLGLACFPVAILLVIASFEKIGVSLELGTICSLVAGLAVLVLAVWKAPRRIQSILGGLRAKAPEPIYSCLSTGLTCALMSAILMAVPIFLLGHTRPQGWDLDRIPPFILGASVLGLMIGFPLGRERGRERRSQGKPVAQSQGGLYSSDKA